MNQPEQVTKGPLQIVGISTKTTNEMEMSAGGKIPVLWETFYKERVSDRIPNRQKASPTVALYSDYESDETGAYTFTIGEIVEGVAAVPKGMAAFHVPQTKYAVFTTRKGPVSAVVPEAWQHIWEWSKEHKRAFTFDFEWYDERSADPEYAQVDIYIAVE